MATKATIADDEDLCATRLAHQVAEEVGLRSCLDLTHSQYYLGTSIRSAILRVSAVVILLALFLWRYPSDQNPIWPILAFVALNEIVRINCRTNALYRLMQIYAKRDREAARNKWGEQDDAVQPTAAVDSKLK